MESHSNNLNLRDIILGGQDGLVNVLGVVLGVSAATSDLKIILISGLAATFAESISMAAVAYTSTDAEQSQYQKELRQEKDEVDKTPDKERDEVRKVFEGWGFDGDLLEKATEKITSSKESWTRFMMSEELGLQKGRIENPLKAAVVVGLASFVGSVIPLFPFFVIQNLNASVIFSLILCAIVLFATGAVKAKLTVGTPAKEGVKLMLIGMVSAIIGYGIGMILGSDVRLF